MKKFLLIIFIAIINISYLNADIESNVFCDYEPSARARGMGGAYICSCNDANAIFYNPAALLTADKGVIVSYAKLFGLDFEVLKTGAFSYNIPKIGTIALGIKTMDTEFEDEILMSEGTYSIAHSFLVIGDVHSKLYFGYALNLNHINFGETIEGNDPGKENLLGIDLGGLAELHRRTKIAFSVKNINNPSIGKDYTSDLPQYLTIGIAYEPYQAVITEFNLKQKFSEDTQVKIGIEYEIIDNFWLRTGASTNPNSMSLGIGLLMQGIKFDYGFNTHPVLNSTHHFSIGYYF